MSSSLSTAGDELFGLVGDVAVVIRVAAVETSFLPAAKILSATSIDSEARLAVPISYILVNKMKNVYMVEKSFLGLFTGASVMAE